MFYNRGIKDIVQNNRVSVKSMILSNSKLRRLYVSVGYVYNSDKTVFVCRILKTSLKLKKIQSWKMVWFTKALIIRL